MMLHSAAADMPRGLRKPFPGRGNALGRGDPVRTRTGWDGRVRALAGLGLTDAEITAALVAGAGPGTPAYEARYGAGGTYLREPSVIATYGDANADQIADVSYDPVTREWVGTNPAFSAPPEGAPPVNLYVAIQCGPSDFACIAENERRQLANLRIIENANRAFNLQVCRYNASLNPASVNVNDCGRFSPLPVLQATGEMRTVSPSGGEYSIPIGGETAAQLQARTQQWTAQQTASASTNQPNQSVPPRPQPGEVPTGGITAAELAAILAAQNKQTAAPAGPGFSLVDADGKIMGLEPMTLALIAAGVGALMLLKK